NGNDSVNTVTSDAVSKGNGHNVSGRLEASRKLNDKGRVLSISLSAGEGKTLNDSYNYSLTRFLLDPNMNDELIDQQIDYNNKNFDYRAFVSFVEPVGTNNFVQVSYRYNASEREALKNAYSSDISGNYNVLDSTYSQSSRNISSNQRASIAFKAQRRIYDYTVGFNVDPSYSKLETFVGDDVLSSASRNVVNFSPTVQFNYRPSRDFNVRVDYDGETSQPSMQQLQPVEDVSNPLNTTIGNPDLKPIYTNNLQMRFQKYNQEKQSMFMIMANGNQVVNDVVSFMTNDPATGKRYTTYKNINGNYQGNVRFIFNTPVFKKLISINNMAFLSYRNQNSFINAEQNTNKSLQIQDRPGISYRSDLFDFGLNGNFSYQRTRNSLDGQQDLNTYNYGGGANTTLYLPLKFRIESDINYSTNQGYTSGYEQKELLWNASVSKDFLKGNAGTLRLKVYDILQQRSNISYTSTSSYTRYSEYNTLTSYFMFHFIYRFNIFKGGGAATDMQRYRPDGSPAGPGPGGPGGGGQRMGGAQMTRPMM
ncbi:MAG: outer membrane beta-barrel family protein, partial [Tannerella sp.]|nr:outer membrane beta-barrel family protein [Tannerella sp.]